MNVAISFYRTDARRSRHTIPADDSILEIPATEAGEPDERVRLLNEFIRRLDDLDRALGIVETNVGTKIGRIKERIRRDFERTAS